jgi:hypothetical protein
MPEHTKCIRAVPEKQAHLLPRGAAERSNRPGELVPQDDGERASAPVRVFQVGRHGMHTGRHLRQVWGEVGQDGERDLLAVHALHL